MRQGRWEGRKRGRNFGSETSSLQSPPPPPLPLLLFSSVCLSFIACSAGIFVVQCSINCHSCIEPPSWISKVRSWNELTPPSFFYLTPTPSGRFSSAPQTFSQRQRIPQTNTERSLAPKIGLHSGLLV